MASPACHHKLPALSRITPDRHHIQHPHHLSFMPHQDACTNFPHSFFVFPSPASPSNAPFVRNVFEDAVCDSLSPDLSGTHPTTSVNACPAPSSTKLSTDNSANSSFSSSSDFCMSSNSDNDEDDTDSSSSSSLSKFGEVSAQEGPLDSLASLCAALPIKRGLSRYFSGKSQSFTSLAKVSSVAELAKPQNPYVKRRRTAGVGADAVLKHHSYPPRCSSSAGIYKRPATCNRYKSVKSIPCPDGVALEGLAKCFSVPEF